MLRQVANRQSVEFYQQAMEAHEADRNDEALRLLHRSVRSEPANAYAWTALGVVSFEQNQVEESARAFRQAIKLAPRRPEPHYNLAVVLESVGRYTQAIEAYEAALQLQPDDLFTMENLARCYRRQGVKPEKVAELLDRALAVEDRPQWRAWLQRESRPDQGQMMPPP
jgi:tetratricopeptide (TPR) repeat protein